MKIAVAGGTGLVGSAVVAELQSRGIDAVTLTRGNGINLETGAGLDGALDGVTAVIDATAITTMARTPAEKFFTAVAANLQREAAKAGVSRIVTLSIVGIDKASGFGYYAAKLAQEHAALGGTVPATILRATQFHEFAGQIVEWTRKGPLAFVTKQPIQSVAVPTVAQHLVELALDTSPASGAIVELAGPERGELSDQAKRLRAATGTTRPFLIAVKAPGAAGKAIRSGVLTAGPDTVIDGIGFSEWLRTR